MTTPSNARAAARAAADFPLAVGPAKTIAFFALRAAGRLLASRPSIETSRFSLFMHITLIADPATEKLSPEAAAEASRALARAGAAVADIKWLAPCIAGDLFVMAPPLPELGAAVARALAGWPIDVVVQDATLRRKRLLVADMESTIIVNEMVDELALLLGIGAQGGGDHAGDGWRHSVP